MKCIGKRETFKNQRERQNHIRYKLILCNKYIPGLFFRFLAQISNVIRRYTVDNKKKHIPLVFQPFFFPVYLRNRLSYKKSVFIFLYPFLNSFQLEQEFFKSGYKIS